MNDIYFSVDIEADGPIPGQYSMLAFGLCVAATFDGKKFQPRDPAANTFYRELTPIFDAVDQKALAVSGLNRASLASMGSDASQSMQEAADWVAEAAGSARPVLVGYPIVFDWMFIHWYFSHFLGESPFRSSSALDMKSMYQSKAFVLVGEAGRRNLPAKLKAQRPHTHNALDDAIEQAEIFNRLFVWKGPQ
jgi:hypothetical protein